MPARCPVISASRAVSGDCSSGFGDLVGERRRSHWLHASELGECALTHPPMACCFAMVARSRNWHDDHWPHLRQPPV